ncbi:hypothetical protein GSH19_04740 [Lactobacillus sp. S2-2]|uniref:YrhK family protein n=1 Tax=Lactobacillus sp. S2-2 TaxID=2692917 RepID=UPI001F30D2E8|nr:YrhK family protein [Lactobacillus sp. S2-2]MCF6515458.1 hypothetical protein [Lactobacillus sp. S2-2]
MSKKDSLAFYFFGHKVKIYAFYNIVSNVNDIILALFFIIGSVYFFNDKTIFNGTICFLLGSIQLLIKPLISITKDIHINFLIRKDKRKG